jgi:hypothetical protein
MGGGSSSQQTQQSQTQSNTIDPAEMAMFQANYGTAQNNANSLTPYTGQITAGFTPTQLQAQAGITNIANDPTYAANNNTALNSINSVTGHITPQTVQAPTIAAGQLSSTDLSPYMNPYTKDVINTTMTQLGQQQGQTLAQQAQSEANSGAFGGSRSGVAQALTNQYYNQDDASTIAGLNSSNFAQAQQAALNDINNRMGASEFNANANLNAGEFNAANNMTAQQDTFSNALNRAAALQNANSNAFATATDQAGLLSTVGDAQQQQQQAALTNAYNAYQAGQQLTVEQQNLLNSALGMIPVQQTVTGSSNGTTNTQQSGGLSGMLGGLGSLAMGLGKAGLGLSL